MVFENADKIFNKISRSHKNFILTEDEVNAWGYQLVEQGKKNEALQVFKLNTLLFPKSSNVYDSYGEILEALGNRKEAILNYRKSLQLNPENTNATQYLKDKK
ncbi:tetratricopeptide repeat protein [Chryseobacterium sp. SORGH_AS_1175]|uniref:tetratricopeptide repeat protein n=1 Tax=Chryseobacterium sp. SORGH_AS_1175 TaxID=3041760 RepID=UPI0028547DA4|nr:tetratricopeptide repeat protein [Chryseobacterium sp. SORGH_AS_1175]MDR6132346.1 tetratricopeptide (TPR) repeat protein [Chryseobacterium sp. SORGH_AS_1175]